MDDGVQVMIFMGLVLKIPIGFACWLIWWAWRSQPEPVEGPDDGGSDRIRYLRRGPRRPRGPRRGPHPPGTLPLPCPEESGARLTRGAGAARPLTASGRRGHER